MKWIKRDDSEANYEDRRGRTVKRGAAVGGVGVVIVMLFALITGQNPAALMQLAENMASGTEVVEDPSRFHENEDLKVFTLGVFNSANDIWTDLFREHFGMEYRNPVLVNFTDHTTSPCGGASAQTGPFYCPADEKVYIDLSFFHQLVTEFGAEGSEILLQNAYQVLVLTSEDQHPLYQRMYFLDNEADEIDEFLTIWNDVYLGAWTPDGAGETWQLTDEFKQLLRDEGFEFFTESDGYSFYHHSGKSLMVVPRGGVFPDVADGEPVFGINFFTFSDGMNANMLKQGFFVIFSAK